MNRPPIGLQLPTILPFAPVVQESFDLRRLEIGLSTGLGTDFTHYMAMPSPIGKNDKGDLRRNDGVDIITSNGMIYTCAGKFTATITSNTRQQEFGAPSGLLDPSEATLVMPRFYNTAQGVSDGPRIFLAPGDRLYYSDPDADTRVATYHYMTYVPDQDNITRYPVVCLQAPIIDSRNISYIAGVDFAITSDGWIRWIPGGNNPGIDPDTGKGRVYTIRYLYKAYYYVVSLPHEVRITNVTVGSVRKPERMPMHAVIVREHIFHDQNKGNKINQNISPTPERAGVSPVESTNPASPIIPVDMTNFTAGSGEEQGNL
jgi:hypothetical protein